MIPQPDAPLHAHLRHSVDERIASVLAQVEPAHLRNAMEHAVAGGKRIRPLLSMLSCAAAGGRPLDALDAGVALELLHTSSLVHDDIMDNASLRRGRETLHVVFDLSTAILAGDALIALAFRVLHRIPARQHERIQTLFSDAFVHLCEGQSYDLAFAWMEALNHSDHQRMVEKKTARLLEAAAAIGAMLGGADERTTRALGRFGLHLGMAYQAMDDLLDVKGSEIQLGKPVGVDVKNGRQTFLTLVRTESHTGATVQTLVEKYTAVACAALETLPDTPARESLLRTANELVGRQA